MSGIKMASDGTAAARRCQHPEWAANYRRTALAAQCEFHAEPTENSTWQRGQVHSRNTRELSIAKIAQELREEPEMSPAIDTMSVM